METQNICRQVMDNSIYTINVIHVIPNLILNATHTEVANQRFYYRGRIVLKILSRFTGEHLF